MISKTEIFNFLKSKKFDLIEETASESFGNYCLIFSSDVIDLRFIRDRSIESVDIRSSKDPQKWYDLGIVQIFIEKGRDSSKVVSVEESILFIRKELDLLDDLFAPENYSITKMNLDALRKDGAKKMFPGYTG